MLTDPVCGKRIKRQRAHIAIDYRGVTRGAYLCCPRCQTDFERAPEKFARPEVGEKTRPSLAHGKTDRHRSEPTQTVTVVRGPVQ
jgi:YHS domain-containing protein